MQLNDSTRLDFLEKWETGSYPDTWFTILTQHVSKKDYPTLRDFCDYGIQFEKMLDTNGLDVIAWHYLPIHLMEIVLEVWEKENRTLTPDEKATLQSESDKYWQELQQTGEAYEDK